VRPDYMRAMR